MPRSRLITAYKYSLLYGVISGIFASCTPPYENSNISPNVISSEAEMLWTDLEGKDPAKAYAAMGWFATNSTSINFITEHIILIPPDIGRINCLIAHLDADDFSVRENASRVLERMGEAIEGELRSALITATAPEIKDRLIKLLDGIEHSREIPMPPGESLRRCLAIQILEMTGTPEAFITLANRKKNSHAIWEREAIDKAMARIRARMTIVQASKSTFPLPISFENSIKMKYQYIPWGGFIMGSPPGELGRLKEEIQHKVKLTKGFYLSATETTQAQWKSVMGEKNNPSNFKGDDLPVENVSWDSAIEFCLKLSQKEGRKYRLPTESEWEYACRAGSTTAYNKGETITTDNANYKGDVTLGIGALKGIFRGKTMPVGSFPPNAWGLYDMHGNVWEWCQDFYGPYPSPKDLTVDPQGPSTGNAHVLRGGSWDLVPWLNRSAIRQGPNPYSRNGSVGFRVALDL